LPRVLSVFSKLVVFLIGAVSALAEVTVTTTPAGGAATEVALNAAGTPTAKNYAAGAGEAYTYFPGGLLERVIWRLRSVNPDEDPDLSARLLKRVSK